MMDKIKMRNKKTRNKRVLKNKTMKKGGLNAVSKFINKAKTGELMNSIKKYDKKLGEAVVKKRLENNDPKNSLINKMKSFGSNIKESTGKAFTNIKDSTTNLFKSKDESIDKNEKSFFKKTTNYISDKYNSIGSQVISNKHKQIIMDELKKLKGTKITEKEYKHAIKQITKRDGLYGAQDSFFNMLYGIQNMIKIVGDWVFNSADDDYPAKKTHVKLLWVPKMYKNYVKNQIPEKNLQDLELDDFLIVTKELYANPMEKINKDINSVDSLLANILNGCIGPECKNGQTSIPILLEKSFDITDNIGKKEELNNRIKQKNMDIQLSNSA